MALCKGQELPPPLAKAEQMAAVDVVWNNIWWEEKLAMEILKIHPPLPVEGRHLGNCCVIWPANRLSCSGAHFHSWLTVEDTGTNAVVSQNFNPWPFSPPLQAVLLLHPPAPCTCSPGSDPSDVVLQWSVARQTPCKDVNKEKATCCGPNSVSFGGNAYLDSLGPLNTKFSCSLPHILVLQDRKTHTACFTIVLCRTVSGAVWRSLLSSCYQPLKSQITHLSFTN